MHPKRITEKGFGSESFGVATVIADVYGNPITARPVKMPDGSIGAEVFMINSKYRRDNAPDYIISNDVYQVIVNRRGLVGEVKILMWNLDNEFPQATELMVRFDIHENAPRILCDNSLGSAEAKDLLTSTLQNAFIAAINRSMTAKPDSAFYAVFAKNAKMAERKVVEKKVHATA